MCRPRHVHRKRRRDGSCHGTVEQAAERRTHQQQLQGCRQQREDDAAEEGLRGACAALEHSRQLAGAPVQVIPNVQAEHVAKGVVSHAPRDRLQQGDGLGAVKAALGDVLHGRLVQVARGRARGRPCVARPVCCIRSGGDKQ